MKIFLASLTLFLCSCVAQAQSCTTLPLAYCGPTDMAPRNPAAPTLGAAGTSTTDPDYGTKALRVTQLGSCGTSTSEGFVPNDGEGWKHSINKDNTKIRLFTQGGGPSYYQGINPSANPITTTGACVDIGSKCLRFTNWSYVTANLLYCLSAADSVHLDSWDTVPGDPVTHIVDWSTVPGVTAGAFPFRELEVDDSDIMFCTANGAQDQADAFQVICYNKSNGNTQVLDLHAATSKQNSSAPVALDNLSVAQLANCVIHDVIIGRDGLWVFIPTNACTALPNPPGGAVGRIFWQLGTNHVTYIPNASFTSTHMAMGYVGAFIHGNGQQPPCTSFDERGWDYWFATDLGSNASPKYVEFPGTCYNAVNPTSTDSHVTWLNNKNDASVNAYPIIAIQNNDVTGTNTHNPWEWEIIALPTAAAKAAWLASSFATTVGANPSRIGHTFNDPTANQCTDMAFQSPNVSQDGRLVVFSSDWLGQTGAGTCLNNKRVDVFVWDASTTTPGSSIALNVKVTSGASLK